MGVNSDIDIRSRAIAKKIKMECLKNRLKLQLCCEIENIVYEYSKKAGEYGKNNPSASSYDKKMKAHDLICDFSNSIKSRNSALILKLGDIVLIGIKEMLNID